jgi:diadenosine tetraphosphate (Ap4A) HIT family hydrolase
MRLRKCTRRSATGQRKTVQSANHPSQVDLSNAAVTCPFCSVHESRVAFSNESVIAIWDGFPVSRGHLLIIPRRNTPAWPNLTAIEKAAIVEAIDRGRATISERSSPDGFNVGFDENPAAGQTVSHFHLHIIPRYEGEVA